MVSKAIATLAAATLAIGSLAACGGSTRICVTKAEIRRVSDHNCNPSVDDNGGLYKAVYIPQGEPVPAVGEQVKGEYHTTNPD